MRSETLAQISLFEGLSDEELDACAELFSERLVMAGDRLTDESEYGYSFFVVVDGEVKVVVGGEEVVRLGPGEHFGEIALVSEDERRTASVIATQITRLAKLMTWDFQKVMKRHPGLARRLQAIADQRRRAV